MNEYIKGTQTESTLNWTGVTSRNYLYDDMTITYRNPFRCNGSPTLNLELFDGTKTGAIPIYSDSTYFGENSEYCIDRPEVGLWRIPIMLVLIIGLNLFTLPLLIADNLVVEEGA